MPESAEYEYGQIKADWTDPASGYRCVVLVGPMGALNGYVRIPDDHPWRHVGYSGSYCGHPGCYEHTPESLVRVHGGLTFDGTLKEAGEGYWFGFDCAHAGDYVPRLGRTISPGDVYRDVPYLVAECTRLAEQLHAHSGREEA